MTDEMIIEQSPDAIICADNKGNIIRWNRAASKIFGYNEDEAVGKNLDLIIPLNLRAAHWVGFYIAVEVGSTKHNGHATLTSAIHKNGSKIYVDVAFGLIKHNSGSVCGVIATARPCNSE